MVIGSTNMEKRCVLLWQYGYLKIVHVVCYSLCNMGIEWTWYRQVMLLQSSQSIKQPRIFSLPHSVVFKLSLIYVIFYIATWYPSLRRHFACHCLAYCLKTVCPLGHFLEKEGGVFLASFVRSLGRSRIYLLIPMNPHFPMKLFK